MGEIKHTPGPWIVRPDYADDGHVDELRGFDIVSSSGVEVVSCQGIIPGPLSREDAHLIAAAPDLLKELGDLVELLDGMRHSISWEVSMDDILAGSRAALSKASPSEGGEA